MQKPIHVSLVAVPSASISTLHGLYDVLNGFTLLGPYDDALPSVAPFRVALADTSLAALGYGLTDSPSGQAAWILEKFWAWTDNDGDPADVLVVLPLPLVPGSVIRCRPVGVLKMTDEAGSDEKLLAVPVEKVFQGYAHVDNIDKVSAHWLERIGHFFEHYKDLEKGKWVKLEGWGSAEEAKKILVYAMERHAAQVRQPA